MKTTIKKLSIAFLTANLLNVSAQKQTIAVLNIDTKNISIDAASMGGLARIQLERLDTFKVIDKYEVQQMMETSKVSFQNCFGKNCLVEAGLLLKANKMFTGSIELVGKNINVTFRIIDVAKNETERTYVHEFLDLNEEIQNMVKLSIAEMFNKPFDKNLMTKLSKKYAYDNSNNNPDIPILELSGPRMGFIAYTGRDLTIIQDKKSNGGFDLFPAMFQFGYQFEKQYLNEGKIQALFELVPMITGLDQGYFIPSISLFHGVRSNVSGWEFAFGPSFNVAKKADGYYDNKGNWQLNSSWSKSDEYTGQKNPHESTTRMDSRGDYRFQSYFVLAAGRTFKSGRLNIPVNVYVIPGRDGWRYGVSFGFNAKNRV